jgi:ketosteroid isomerase-like protein
MNATLDLTSVVIRFNQALNAGDVDAMMQCMTPNCIFENTSPAPDGTRYEGQAAVRAFWEDFFRNASHAQIETEEIFAFGSHCVMRWRYDWVDQDGQPGHIRGVDIYQIYDGLIAEKLSYVKG